MAKPKTHFTCQSCGYQSPKWLGRCTECGTWGSTGRGGRAVPGQPVSPGLGRRRRAGSSRCCSRTSSRPSEARRLTGIAELDRVLGGGVVQGSLVLIGGDPGHRQVDAAAQGDRPAGRSTGRPSTSPARSRCGRRACAPSAWASRASSCTSSPRPTSRRCWPPPTSWRPGAWSSTPSRRCSSPSSGSAPGSVSQVRECAGRLMAFAKKTGVPTFMVGHVTKDGAIAGPRVLEHMVDTVLYFEGERGHPFRILRAHKNRFGSTNEIGVFEMKGVGPGRGARPLRPLPRRAAQGRVGHRGHRDAQRHPAAPGRGAGAGRAHRLRHRAAHRHRRRLQPRGAARRGAGEEGRRAARRLRHLRQRRRRHRARPSPRATWRCARRWCRRCTNRPIDAQTLSSARWAWPARCARWPRSSRGWPRPRRWASAACVLPKASARRLEKRPPRAGGGGLAGGGAAAAAKLNGWVLPLSPGTEPVQRNAGRAQLERSGGCAEAK